MGRGMGIIHTPAHLAEKAQTAPANFETDRLVCYHRPVDKLRGDFYLAVQYKIEPPGLDDQ